MIDTIFGIITIIVIALIVTFYITWSKKKRWLYQQNVINHILQLKTIIAFTQKHRGMSAAYIQGDNKALEVLSNIEDNLQPIITKLSGYTLIAKQERWIGYLDHWQRLKNQCKQFDLETSFNQHTTLILNLLYLFEDISEQREFNKKSYEGTANSPALWQDLPFTAEYIGQSRAVGVAIVARGVCTQVDIVKLGYLETKIAQLSTHVFTYLERNGCQQTQLINHARIHCQKFTTLLRQQILEVNKIEISTELYFTTASQAMDAINRLLDEELHGLQEQIIHAY